MDIKSGSSSEKKRSFFQRRLSPHSPGDTGPNPLLLPGSNGRDGGGGGSRASNNNSIINLAKNHRSSSLTKTNSSTSVGSAGGGNGGGPFSGIPKATGPKNADAIGAQLMSHVTSTNNNKGKPGGQVAFDEATAAAAAGSRPMKASTATSKAVNGILRKGSNPGSDIVTTTAVTLTAKAPDEAPDPKTAATPLLPTEGGKKRGKSKSRSKQKSSSKSSGKLASLSESAGEDGGTTGGGGSVSITTGRSRSNSTKSNKEKEKADKIQKDLALTRDLPWCGCWGNGCL